MRPRVWAPNVSQVELVTFRDPQPAVTPMQRRDDGWWETADVLSPGDRYGFRLDGGDVLPDPRSRWQPDGVHGPSGVSDVPPARSWPGRSIVGSVIYELHIGTFTQAGTFDAAIERLDYLVELGVDAVEILPVAAFPGHHGWGYDGVFPFAVHEPYGGPAGMRRFVDACHAKGLAVVLDVVYNHLGPDGNVLGRFGPYFTDTYQTPWGPALNVDAAESDDVRRYVIDNALWWLEDVGVDGLRLDAVHAIVDLSATHILEELAVTVCRAAQRSGRPLQLIAESDRNDPRLITPRGHGGYALDAQWSDDFHHALHVTLTGETSGYYADFRGPTDVAAALTHGYVYTGQYSPYRRRRHGRPLPPDLSAHRLLGYAQTHDQVGNRARGERLCHLVSTERARIAAALVLTAPFTPMLFMGEEWAADTPWQYFTDHQDPNLARAVREGRRAEFAAFGWPPEDVPDPQDPETFHRSILNWSELADTSHREMLAWYRALIALRRAEPALRDPHFADASWDEPTQILRIQRGDMVVAVNLGDKPMRIALPVRDVLLSSGDVDATGADIYLPPLAVAIARTTLRGEMP